MFLSIENLKGYKVQGTDGDVGRLSSFLFNDENWIVRYIMIDTGPFIFGKEVLLSPNAVEHFKDRSISVTLSTDQIKNSPSIDTDKPVSRQMEITLHNYYGWPYYWNMQSSYISTPPPLTFPVGTDSITGDPHLRSTKEVIGYEVRSRNKIVGHVDDFILDNEIWKIPYVVIDTKKYLSGKKVLIGIRRVKDIRWTDSEFIVDISLKVIESSPEFDPHEPINSNFQEVH